MGGTRFKSEFIQFPFTLNIVLEKLFTLLQNRVFSNLFSWMQEDNIGT